MLLTYFLLTTLHNYIIETVSVMTEIVSKQSLDYFYDIFYNGHLKEKKFQYLLTQVHQIDGLKVEVYVESSIDKKRNGITKIKSYNHTMSYRVLWKPLEYCLHDYCVSTVIKSNKEIRHTINLMLLDLHKNLPLMKLNKYSGKFNTTIICEGFDSCYLTDEVCCVCLQNTVTKTTCLHSICIDCCHQMKKTTISRDLTCPLCRSLFLIQDDDEYDSDLDFSIVSDVSEVSDNDDDDYDDESAEETVEENSSEALPIGETDVDDNTKSVLYWSEKK